MNRKETKERIKKYCKARDEAIESKDVNKFMEFLKEHKDQLRDGIYETFCERRETLGDDFIMLTMAKMAEDITSLSKETKTFYACWLIKWRMNYGHTNPSA